MATLAYGFGQGKSQNADGGAEQVERHPVLVSDISKTAGHGLEMKT